jgi:hypothetical protein
MLRTPHRGRAGSEEYRLAVADSPGTYAGPKIASTARRTPLLASWHYAVRSLGSYTRGPGLFISERAVKRPNLYFCGSVGLYGPGDPLSPVLAPDEPEFAGMSAGGCASMGIVGEVGDTCEFFSLPGPTFPGRTSAPLVPLFTLSGGEPPSDCANTDDTTNSAVKTLATRGFHM